jgi:cytochrome c oxidase subunit 2
MKKKFAVLVLSLTALLFAVALSRPTIAQAAPHRIEVTVSKFNFAPAEITVKKGEPVVIVLKSADANHGLRFRDLNLDVKVNKGSTGELSFTPTKTGNFAGHCSVFCGSGHGGMTLTMHVVE